MHATYVVSKILAKKGEKSFNDGEKKIMRILKVWGGRYYISISWFINIPDGKENMFSNFMPPELTLEKKKDCSSLSGI